MPKVSVIVPCYNAEKYIANCLDSLVVQTLADIEIICIDDMSTDATYEVLKRYSKSDSRIVVKQHKQNLGVAATRNTGIQSARGEYIAFVDSDDSVDDVFYDRLYAAATRSGADIARGELKSIDIYGRTELMLLNYSINKNKYHFNYCFTTAIYRTEMIKEHKLGFPVGISMAEDTCFLISAVTHANRVITVNDVFYNYIRHDGSLDSAEFSSEKLECALLGSQKLLELVIDLDNISDKDRDILIERAAVTLKHLLNKKIKIDDYKQICLCMSWYYNTVKSKRVLLACWGHRVCNYIKRNDLDGLAKYYATRTIWFWLLGLIPLAKISRYGTQELKFYLFGVIPTFKVRHTHKTEYFLFGIMFLKVK